MNCESHEVTVRAG